MAITVETCEAALVAGGAVRTAAERRAWAADLVATVLDGEAGDGFRLGFSGVTGAPWPDLVGRPGGGYV